MFEWVSRCISENVHTLKAQGLQTCLSQQHHIYSYFSLYLNHLACDYCEFFCIVIYNYRLTACRALYTVHVQYIYIRSRGPHGKMGLFVTADVASILCDGVQLASDVAL